MMPPLFRKFTIGKKETGYIGEEAITTKLKSLWGKDEDFKLMTKNERWSYYAPEKFTEKDIEDMKQRTNGAGVVQTGVEEVEAVDKKA